MSTESECYLINTHPIANTLLISLNPSKSRQISLKNAAYYFYFWSSEFLFLVFRRQLFESFPDLKRRYWGRHFGARGYFCVTSGELTQTMIEEYLEHHFEPKVEDNFRTESD